MKTKTRDLSTCLKRRLWIVGVCLTTFSFLSVSVAYAVSDNQTVQQQKKGMVIKGKVLGTDGEPIIGASVLVKGSTTGVVTDLDGNYTLSNVSKGAILEFSYVGYVKLTKTVGNETTINAILYEDSQMLEGVEVVAFGTQKKESVIGAISTVKVAELKTPSSNLTNALAGRIAGVISYQRTGEPGVDDASFFVRGVTTFGYKKDPDDKDKWIIDEEAATTVRRIFQMYVEGYRISEIGHKLTEEKVETPILYYMNRGIKTNARSEYPEIWDLMSIKYILSQTAYAGHTVKFQTSVKSYKTKKQIRLPKEDWIIYRNTQEPIIDEKTFETVQQMRKVKRARTKYNEPNMFSGLLYCADCGNHLTIQRVARNRKMDNFSCATYRKKKKGLCSCHRILVSDLETIVKEDLQKVCEYVFLHEKEFADEYLSGSKKETVKFQSKTKAELKRLSERQEEIGKIIRKLYEDNVNGRITDERFDFLAKSYEDEGNELKTKIQEFKNALASSVQDEEKLSKFLKVVKSYTKIEELTPEILNSFIEKIYIGETEKYDGRKMQDVEIIYKFVGAINLPQYGSD